MGVIVMGKIESGCCRVGDKCIIMPNRTRVEVTNIYYEEIETDSCVCGENVRLKLKNVEEEVRAIFNDLFFINQYKFL
jgi:peptide chain release factor subunit 3